MRKHALMRIVKRRLHMLIMIIDFRTHFLYADTIDQLMSLLKYFF